jgi:hypothetical protein
MVTELDTLVVQQLVAHAKISEVDALLVPTSSEMRLAYLACVRNTLGRISEVAVNVAFSALSPHIITQPDHFELGQNLVQKLTLRGAITSYLLMRAHQYTGVDYCADIIKLLTAIPTASFIEGDTTFPDSGQVACMVTCENFIDELPELKRALFRRKLVMDGPAQGE